MHNSFMRLSFMLHNAKYTSTLYTVHSEHILTGPVHARFKIQVPNRASYTVHKTMLVKFCNTFLDNITSNFMHVF
jgi:hypothetical protein